MRGNGGGCLVFDVWEGRRGLGIVGAGIADGVDIVTLSPRAYNPPPYNEPSE